MDTENSSNEGPNDGIIGSIDIPSPESVIDLTGQIHQLPCCIKHDGPCSVSHYFKPIKTGIEVEGGLNLEETYFRGRKLQGATIPLPQGYSGFVLGKKKNSKKRKTSGISEENSNCWETCARFQSITYWNHDTLPSNDDVLLRSFHWLPVANALHRPVSADDLATVSTLPGQS